MTCLRFESGISSIPTLEHAMNKTSLFVYAGYAVAAVALYVILLVLPG